MTQTMNVRFFEIFDYYEILLNTLGIVNFLYAYKSRIVQD